MQLVDDDPTLPHVLSLGAGVQSSTLALMAARGLVEPMPTAAVFADTGWEPAEVYRWFDWLVPRLPFPVHRVQRGNIHEDGLRSRVRATLGEGSRWVAIPYFTIGDGDRNRGQLTRQCTKEYKIQPIEEWMKRDLLGIPKRGRLPKEPRIVQWRGISADERQRAKLSMAPWYDVRYPLIEAGMTRGHCLEWMQSHGYPQPPRSACIGCPYKSDREWIELREEAPHEWRQAVEFDAAIRHTGGQDRLMYLHASCEPLGEVELVTAETAGQRSLFDDECLGMCGI